MSYWPRVQFFSNHVSERGSWVSKTGSYLYLPFQIHPNYSLAVRTPRKNDCIVEKVVFGKVIALFVGSAPSLAHKVEIYKNNTRKPHCKAVVCMFKPFASWRHKGPHALSGSSLREKPVGFNSFGEGQEGVLRQPSQPRVDGNHLVPWTLYSSRSCLKQSKETGP